jgi:hypothetical protein
MKVINGSLGSFFKGKIVVSDTVIHCHAPYLFVIAILEGLTKLMSKAVKAPSS